MNTLQAFFTAILNMSVTATYVTAGVILVRMFLRKAPKIFSYILWSVVLFRLICPISLPSSFSLLGLLSADSQNNTGMLEYVPKDIGSMQTPAIQSGISSLDNTVNSYLSQVKPIASGSPIQIMLNVLSLIWLAGIVILLFYSVISYNKTKRRLKTATLVKDNIYESDRISTAFVCGLISPKIYIPLGVSSTDIFYIIEHERTHIRRKDYLIKPLAFLALILHWFNPVIWISYFLMSKDMEMSCDERVMKHKNGESRSTYSNLLLSMSSKQSGLLEPLSFGQINVGSRIKNILNYKKPAMWITGAICILIVLSTILLISNPIIGKNQIALESIKNVLIKSTTIADKTYIDANNYFKSNTLEDEIDSIISTHTENFNDVFSDAISSKDTMKLKWINAQVTNIADGPDCVDCGVSNILVKDISISNNTASVTAVLTKYLVDRIVKDGKNYLDKMESEVFIKAVLEKENGKWKIVEYESDPQYGNTTHTLTEEK